MKTFKKILIVSMVLTAFGAAAFAAEQVDCTAINDSTQAKQPESTKLDKKDDNKAEGSSVEGAKH